MLSSNLLEIVGRGDRVLVMHQGQLSFFWQLVVKGRVIIIAVTIDRLRTRSIAR
jgi:predicted ABC-type sugar transport system permease subunit